MKLFVSFVIACALIASTYVFLSSQGMSPAQQGSGVAAVGEREYVSRAVAAVNEVTLAPDVTAEVSGLSIRFNTMVQDYRCPVDAECMEGGAIVASVTLEHEEMTETRNFPSDEVPFEFQGYKISIVGVAPDARSGVSLKPDEYRVTFKVE